MLCGQNLCSVYLLSPAFIYFSISAFLLAFLVLFVSRYFDIRKKVFFIYLHLAFLFSPAIYLLVRQECGFPVWTCPYNKLIFLGILSVSFILFSGMFLVPRIFILITRPKRVDTRWILDFINNYSNMLRIKAPRIFLANEARPFAYSLFAFYPSILISVGMFDIFYRKEIEAVLLHELYHLRSRAPIFKFSTVFAKFISPIARVFGFFDELSLEEKRADEFAVKMQGTDKFLESAKRKAEWVGRRI